MKKLRNINKFSSIVLLIVVWQVVSDVGLVPKFMLPSFTDVMKALIDDLPLLLHHSKYTLFEAFSGLFIGVVLGFVIAVLMDYFPLAYRSIYPLLIISQTIPTVAIAPLLVLWMGYGIAPKITLVVMTTFFPIAIGCYNGFKAVDEDMIHCLKIMSASKFQQFKYAKLPSAIHHFFSSLKISVSYSIVGAVVAEWLGGFNGLGVYMTRVRKSYSFDKMFAVIVFISLLSIVCMALVSWIQKKMMPWERE